MPGPAISASSRTSSTMRSCSRPVRRSMPAISALRASLPPTRAERRSRTSSGSGSKRYLERGEPDLFDRVMRLLVMTGFELSASESGPRRRAPRPQPERDAHAPRQSRHHRRSRAAQGVRRRRTARRRVSRQVPRRRAARPEPARGSAAPHSPPRSARATLAHCSRMSGHGGDLHQRPAPIGPSAVEALASAPGPADRLAVRR